MQHSCTRALAKAALPLAALASAIFFPGLPGFATIRSSASGHSTVSSGLFAVVVTPTSVTTAPHCPATTTRCKSVSVGGGSSSQLHLFNAGTLTLVGLSYTLTLNGGTAGSRSVTVLACTGPWTLSPLSCSGTTTTLASNATSETFATTSDVPKAPGAEIYLAIVPNNLLHHPTTITLSVSVCSASSGCTNSAKTRQIRAAQHSNA